MDGVVPASSRVNGAASTIGGLRRFGILLLSTTVLGFGTAATKTTPAHAQGARTAAAGQTVRFSISAQPLSSAVTAFIRATGWQISYSTALVQGKTSAAIVGDMPPAQALKRLVAGTGIDVRIGAAGSAALIDSAAFNANSAVASDGTLMLDTIDVYGTGRTAVEAPYQTPAPVSHISGETIERFRGSSPADIFRGTPGVLSGEARNGGGSIDVNVRGMQGMGRVAVNVDGAENGLSVYQGYQGISNRTYIDPDLLAGADILKGSDASSRGIAGTVSMRTLGANDVVKPGEKWGVWVKGGFGTNTTAPKPGSLGGYTWPMPYVSDPQPYPVPTAQASGLDRPNALTPTSGSFSTIAAIKEKNYDLLWGYAKRQQGNYFAGKNGPGAQVIDTGPQPLCYPSGTCYYPPHPISYAHVYQNGGLSSYRAGEQVLNTWLNTESWIAKGTLRDNNGQSLQLGYNGYRAQAGDLLASLFGSTRSQAVEQTQSDDTKLDTGTLRYRFQPNENGFVDLKANLWLTTLRLRTPLRVSSAAAKPEDFGLPRDYKTGNDARMWGGDVSNKSHLSLNRFGSFDLTYGFSYIHESTQPTPYSSQLTLGIPTRDGTRSESGFFGKVAYKPVDWLTLNGGLRYSRSTSLDLSTQTNAAYVNPDASREYKGYSPSGGVVVEPIKGAQLYANYSSALRMPTLFETVAAYTLVVNPNLRPERSNNWEFGVNLDKTGLFSSNDKAMMKFGYFNWNVKDYVARQSRQFVDPTYGYAYTALTILNIDRAKFSGLEFSGRYENGGFSADLAANYYLNVEFCPIPNSCSASTLSGDYATNQVPPQYSANLTLSQKLLNDDLTVGTRVSHTGPRSVKYGAVQYGAAAIISPIVWQPYWLFDVFAEYKLTRDVTMWTSVENLNDQYYVDPLSLVAQPSPGRTLRFGMTGKFGGAEPASPASLGRVFAPARTAANWSGFYAGVNGAYNYADITGRTTQLDGTSGRYGASESPDFNLDAMSFGIHAGFNHQFVNRMVVGVEADIAKTQMSGSQITYATEGATENFGSNLFRQRQYEAVQKESVQWLSTLRGRLGYAVNDRLMVYGTGGLAFMRHDAERTQYATVSRSFTTTAATFTEEASRTRTGYVIGGGLEYALDKSWSLKGEYLLARFAEEGPMVFANAKAGVVDANNYGYPVTANTVTGRRVFSKVDIPMIRLGVNYRF
ncbi:TonB-dependent receptor domain-containing protein [Undibacter mobilis]|uniref:TonB-dependent receptor n=1 Tax=Undibacter mobilis TaxID=2292256 RepID=A0A371B748_9BRAD|nr:TonB-dependent receptor [Undibacter mobilis]RDV03408.1 TonB-dependent receptor [Undibacter mobilis]